MKRSEMIEIIRIASTDNRFYNIKDMEEYILKAIENAGMKPPITEKQIKADEYQASVDYCYNYTAIDELKWEAE